MTDWAVRVAWLATTAAAVVVLLVYAPALEAPFLVPKFAALEVTAAVGFAAFVASGARWSRAVAVGAWLVLGTTAAAWVAACARGDAAPYALDATARWCSLFGLACGAATLEGDREARAGLVETITLAAGAVALLGILQHLGLLPSRLMLPVISLPGSTFGNRNLAAEVVAMALPFGVAATVGSSRGRAPLAVASALSLWFLAVTRARGAWLGGALGVAVVLFALRADLRGRLRVGWSVAIVVVALVAASVPGRWNPHDAGDVKRYEALSHVVEGAADPSSTALRTRVGFWRRSLAMVAEHPVVGVGPGSWPVVFPRYAEPGAARDGVLTMTLAPRQAHDDAIERLAETGVLGLAALLALVVVVARQARTKLAPTMEGRSVTAGAAGALAALVGVSLTGFPLEMPGTLALGGLSLGLVAGQMPAAAGRRRVPRWVAALFGLALVVLVSFRQAHRVEASRWLEVAERALRSDHGSRGADAALAALTRTLDAEPDLFAAELRVAQMRVRKKEGVRAAEAAQQALAIEPSQVNALGALADAYLTAGDGADARRAATSALSVLEDYPLALFVRIQASPRGDLQRTSDRLALEALANDAHDRDTRRTAKALLDELGPEPAPTP